MIKTIITGINFVNDNQGNTTSANVNFNIIADLFAISGYSQISMEDYLQASTNLDTLKSDVVNFVIGQLPTLKIIINGVVFQYDSNQNITGVTVSFVTPGGAVTISGKESMTLEEYLQVAGTMDTLKQSVVNYIQTMLTQEN